MKKSGSHLSSAPKKKKRLWPVFAAAGLLVLLLAAGGGLWLLRDPRPDSFAPGPAPTPAPDYSQLLRISELMGKNRATLRDEAGQFSDWVELENISGEPVSLEGWALSDREDRGKFSLPGVSLAPGERLTLFCGGEPGPRNADFSIGQGEALYLLDPAGVRQDSAVWTLDEADCSLIRQEDGSFVRCPWPSPGYPNTGEGYAAFCAASERTSPVLISEVMVANTLYAAPEGQEPEDWVELENVSAAPVSLTGWHLSDDRNDYALFALPERELQPGERLLILCSGQAALPSSDAVPGGASPDAASGQEQLSSSGPIHAGFSLDAASEQLYLTDASGALADYAALHDIPSNGSLGRMAGENGFFYFALPTPLEANAGGLRRVSARPTTLEPDGCYDGVTSVSVQLQAPGRIYYTLDGSVPHEGSAPYEGPLSLTGTSVVRAVAIEDGALPSPVASFSYLLNEGHSLPVLSLVVDDLPGFNAIYDAGTKDVDIPANLALYENGESVFNHACSASMKGWTSLFQPKKSLGVSFDGIYGGHLDCDVFGNGIREYASLSIRGGQDYNRSIFRNELFQELSQEMSDKVLSQESKFCVLYLNGEYRGIYCLKEDYSRTYYATHSGVSKDSVTMYRTPAPMDSDFYQQVVLAGWRQPMSEDWNYQTIDSLVDLDSLIDWFIIEGYSANTDLQGNARVFRSPENGNKWQFAAYDFDWAFCYSGSDFSIILLEIGNAGNQIPPLLKNLLTNPDFRTRFLTRFSELNRTTLSNEHVLELIDRFQALLEPEVERDWQRWDMDPAAWYDQVDALRRFVTENDWASHNVDQLTRLLYLSADELETYFPD